MRAFVTGAALVFVVIAVAMTSMEFFILSLVEVTKAVAWPAAVLIPFFLLKDELRQFVKELAEIAITRSGISFVRNLASATEQADQAPDDVPKPEHETAAAKKLEILADVSPRDAILRAWTEIHDEANEAFRRLGLSEQTRSRGLVRLVKKEELLPKAALQLLDDLRAMMKQTAQAYLPTITSENAVEYCDLAQRLIELFKKVGT